MNQIITWENLPCDIRVSIFSHLSLNDAFNLNLAYPHSLHSSAIRKRILKLEPLRLAWIHSEQSALSSFANPPHLATPSARISLSSLSFVRLSTITLSGTHLTGLPGIQELRNLRVIDASCNLLSNLPTELSQCKELRVLNLGYNQLSDFPKVVMELPNLCSLLLHHNPIADVPHDSWSRLLYLHRLSLYECKLSGTLPEKLCEWLCTSTQHGRHRSANFDHNNFQRDELENCFSNFPSLPRRIKIENQREVS